MYQLQQRIREYVRTHEPVMLRTLIAELRDSETSDFDLRSAVLLLTAGCIIHIDVHNMVTLTQEGRS